MTQYIEHQKHKLTIPKSSKLNGDPETPQFVESMKNEININNLKIILNNNPMSLDSDGINQQVPTFPNLNDHMLTNLNNPIQELPSPLITERRMSNKMVQTQDPHTVQQISIPQVIRSPDEKTSCHHGQDFPFASGNFSEKSPSLINKNVVIQAKKMNPNEVDSDSTPMTHNSNFNMDRVPKRPLLATNKTYDKKRSNSVMQPGQVIQNKLFYIGDPIERSRTPQPQVSAFLQPRRKQNGTNFSRISNESKRTTRTIINLFKKSMGQIRFAKENRGRTKTIEDVEDYEYKVKMSDIDETEIITFPNGDVYEGQIENGLFHGQGILVWQDGSIYEGNWKKGEKHGKCLEKTADGTFFKGCYKKGLKHGYCSLDFENGDQYDGYFEYDQINNYGIYQWKCGKRYEGEWKNGLFSGNGKMKYENGDIYEGEFAQGVRNGIGTYTWEIGPSYKGSWCLGQRNGDGLFTQVKSF